MFKNLYKYRYLLLEIVKKNIKLQYRNSVLGVFWTFLQPLLTTLVLVLVFSNIFGRDSAAVVRVALVASASDSSAPRLMLVVPSPSSLASRRTSCLLS